MNRIVIADHSGATYTLDDSVSESYVTELFHALREDAIGYKMDVIEGKVIERDDVPIGITCSYPYKPREHPEQKTRTLAITRKEQIDALRDRVTRDRNPLQNLSCQYPGDDFTFTVSRIKGTKKFQLNARVDCLGGGKALTMICDALGK